MVYTYLALGDSYTCGEAVEAEQSFPWQLTARVRGQGRETADPKIIAVTGWTTNELQQGIKQANIQGNVFDMVTLLIGVNNQYRGEAKGFTPDSYRTEFTKLLQTAIRFTGNQPKRVIVISIPDWGATPFAKDQDRARIATEINAYNAINEEESSRAGVQYVDVTPLSRQVANDPALLAPDGLHYSGAMYARWAEAIQPHISFS